MNNTHLVSFRRPVRSSHDRRGGAKKEETGREERLHYSGTSLIHSPRGRKNVWVIDQV